MERENDYILMLWKTKDDKEHHRTFLATELKEAEKFGKEIWQKSALTDAEESEKKDWEKNKKDIIQSMSIFRGRHITWEKEETPVVKSFKLKEIKQE